MSSNDTKRLIAENRRLRRENQKLNDALRDPGDWMLRALARRDQVNALTGEVLAAREELAGLRAAVNALSAGARADRRSVEELLRMCDALMGMLATRRDSSGLPAFQGEVLSVVLTVIDQWMLRNGLCPGIRPGVSGRLEAIGEQLSDAIRQAQAARAVAIAIDEGDREDMSKAKEALLDACHRNRAALN